MQSPPIRGLCLGPGDLVFSRSQFGNRLDKTADTKNVLYNYHS